MACTVCTRLHRHHQNYSMSKRAASHSSLFAVSLLAGGVGVCVCVCWGRGHSVDIQRPQTVSVNSIDRLKTAAKVLRKSLIAYTVISENSAFYKANEQANKQRQNLRVLQLYDRLDLKNKPTRSDPLATL